MTSLAASLSLDGLRGWGRRRAHVAGVRRALAGDEDDGGRVAGEGKVSDVSGFGVEAARWQGLARSFGRGAAVAEVPFPRNHERRAIVPMRVRGDARARWNAYLEGVGTRRVR